MLKLAVHVEGNNGFFIENRQFFLNLTQALEDKYKFASEYKSYEVTSVELLDANHVFVSAVESVSDVETVSDDVPDEDAAMLQAISDMKASSQDDEFDMIDVGLFDKEPLDFDGVLVDVESYD